MRHAQYYAMLFARCGWAVRPGVLCGQPSVAVDMETKRGLCAEHARVAFESRERAVQAEGAAAVEEAARVLREAADH
jgi:hypothetical protein